MAHTSTGELSFRSVEGLVALVGAAGRGETGAGSTDWEWRVLGRVRFLYCSKFVKPRL